MKIQEENLKLKCNFCGKNFICTYNTTECPNCGGEFDPEEIHGVFQRWQTKVENSNSMKISRGLGVTSEIFKLISAILGLILALMFAYIILSLVF